GCHKAVDGEIKPFDYCSGESGKRDLSKRLRRNFRSIGWLFCRAVVAGGHGGSISCGPGTQKSLEYMRGGTEERMGLLKLIAHTSTSPSISTNVSEPTCQNQRVRTNVSECHSSAISL